MNLEVIHEEIRRSALKTVSWRIVATSTGMFLVYMFTGRLELVAGFGVADVALKTVFYFLHERIWDRITFGRTIRGQMQPAIGAPPVTALPTDTVPSVIQKMVTSDIGAVVVVDSGEPFGLITEKDILERLLSAGKDPSKTFAGDIMSSPVATVEFNKSLAEMLKLMQDKQIRRLVVTRNRKVVGIVNERRVLEALI